MASQDATDVFAAFHSPVSWKWLQPLQIGFVSQEVPAVLQDFRRLRSEMLADGLFESSKLYYVMKVCSLSGDGMPGAEIMLQSSSILFLCVLSLLLLRYSTSYLAVVAAASLMARRCANIVAQ